ncbi:hypothetical protein [Falsiroseomonas tokyonensis]|uniref:Uncharacterized protein n=1 Tax=Falsiroseomonas tokyonensis TaxID=430521 RepID=A0ABV7C4M5_9PROT|nr:hypothetical protein [Falsiroseomonas tokyonensis]MBU8541893.1 hypothetical protein [Falsiroseomonas tokyonensis]
MSRKITRKARGWRPSKSQWVAIGSATAGMGVAAGPVGAALTAAGATLGACGANWLEWTDDSEEANDD